MNENSKSSKMLSDDALDRVMLDMFGGLFQSPTDKPPAQADDVDLESNLIAEEDRDNP